jgi:hypothetical protein
MAFTPPGARTPTAITRLSIVLTDQIATGDEPASQSAHYSLVLIDQDGQQIHFPGDTGDLVPHLTSQEIQQLQAFMASLRVRAETQIMGG